MAIQRIGRRSSHWLAELDAGDDVEGVEVEVGLVEAVEQHESVGAGVDDPGREVGHRRVVRAELDGQRDADLGADRGDDVEVGGLDVGRGAVGIGGDVVEVELDGVGAGVFDEPRVAGPATRRAWR